MYVNVKIRLATFAAHLGMSDAQFEKSISMPANTLRRTESSVKAEVLACAVQAYPQLSPDWLLTGSGPMLRPLRDHPNVTAITATAPVDSSSAEYEVTEDPQPTSVEEPTQPYASAPRRRRSQIPMQDEDYISVPRSVFEQLTKQLENKDAQIATLLTKIPAES